MRVSYDHKSFVIDGERLWLVCGEMHYFRIPRALWRKRFQQAKRNGINCISTYMAWDVHESEMDTYCFDGDYDIEYFIKLAQEEGIYIILRPGPYICSEWEFGGFPPYLNTIEGIRFREDNEPYKVRYRKYFRQILPKLAPYDVEHGGNILFIQNENEHIMPYAKGRDAYFIDISACYREAGFEIPIINCNRMFEGDKGMGMIECVNTWDDPTEDTKSMKDAQPDAPLLITELWCGGCDGWNRPFATIKPEDVYKKLVEIVGNHAQYTYYMWHGGTNFGFYGGRLQYAKDYHIITSYDMDAPLSEGGIQGDKYDVTGLINKFCLTFGSTIAAMDRGEKTSDQACHQLTIEGDRGSFLCLWAKDDTADLKAYEYQDMTLDMSRYRSAIIPIDLRLDDAVTLHRSNAMPLMMVDRTIVFYGEIGQEAQIILNDQTIACTIESGIQSFEAEGYGVVVVDHEMAKHMDMESLTTQVKPTEVEAETLPELTWEACGLPKVTWVDVDGPMGFDAMGNYFGYGWYRTMVMCDEATTYDLHLPYCEDRCTIYHDDKKIGTWGVGSAATLEMVKVELHKGANQLTFFVDNMGRMTHSYRMGEKKGLYGDIYHAKGLPLHPRGIERFEDSDPPILMDMLNGFDPANAASIKFGFTMDIHCEAHMLLEVGSPAKIYVNGTYLGFYQNPFHGFVDEVIPEELLKEGENELKIIVYTDPTDVIFDLKLHAMLQSVIGKELSQNWQFAYWDESSEPLDDTKSEYPHWYTASFGTIDDTKPLFVRFEDYNKGQLYINGHNAGRVYSGVPQDTYYIPECWLEDENNLVYFAEDGIVHGNVYLERERSWGNGKGTFTLDVL